MARRPMWKVGLPVVFLLLLSGGAGASHAAEADAWQAALILARQAAYACRCSTYGGGAKAAVSSQQTRRSGARRGGAHRLMARRRHRRGAPVGPLPHIDIFSSLRERSLAAQKQVSAGTDLVTHGRRGICKVRSTSSRRAHVIAYACSWRIRCLAPAARRSRKRRFRQAACRW